MLDICMAVGCSRYLWFGRTRKYTVTTCSGCRQHLLAICKFNSTTPCKDRKRRGTNNDWENYNEERSASSSSAGHKTREKNERKFVGATSSLKSAFFTLSSAIKSGTVRTQNDEETDVEIDANMFVEIVQSTGGVVIIIAAGAFINKTRARVNKLIRRIAPKSKFPVPKSTPGGINEHALYMPTYQAMHQQQSSPQSAPQQPLPYKKDFSVMHSSMKPIIKQENVFPGTPFLAMKTEATGSPSPSATELEVCVTQAFCQHRS